MQTVSAAYTAAVSAKTRIPRRRVLVAWGGDPTADTPEPGDELGDITRYVVNGSLDAALTTDLPEETRLVTGYASTKLTLTLSGDPRDGTRHGAWLWSPFNTASPYCSIGRIGSKVVVQLGFETDDGPEYVTVFTGQVTKLQATVGSAGRTATLEALDGAERLRGRVDLPQMVGSDPTDSDFQPGLNSQAILERILATGGYHASPPPRPDAVYAATFHGSAFPQVGTLLSTQRTNVGNIPVLAEPLPYTPGKFGLALSSAVPDVLFVLAEGECTSEPSIEPGAALFIEAWMTGAGVQISTDSGTFGAGQREWSFDTNIGGLLSFAATRGGGTTATPPDMAVPTDGDLHYCAVYAEFGTTTATITMRVDETEQTHTVAIDAPAGPPDPMADRLLVAANEPLSASGGGSLVESVQICTGHQSPIVWSDDWSPTLLMEPGLSELVAPPTTSADDAWALAQQVVAAEYGTLRFDPAGRAVFWNRQHWRKSAVANTVQRTITTTESIMDMSSVEIAGAVRTQIRVPFQPLTILPVSVVWQQTEQIMVPARGEVTRNLDLGGDTVWAVDTTGWVIPAGGALSAAGQNKSGYRAARKPDGSGGQVTTVAMDIVPAANTIRVTWINPEATDVWLVTAAGASSPNGGPTYPTSSVGEPSSQIVGKRVTKQAPDLDTSNVDPSRPTGAFTEAIVPDLDPGQAVLYTAPDSPWRQNGDDAQGLADDLLRALYRAMPQIQGLSIVADPAIELGDRLQVQDAGGLALNEPFWVAALNLRFDSAGMTESLTLRPVAAPGQFIFGVTGRDVLNETPL